MIFKNMAKIVSFEDFKKAEEKEELMKVKRSFSKNSNDKQQFLSNTKYKYNYTTRKMDDLDQELLDDSIEDLEDDK
jgi:hypothetical protein